MSGMDTSQTITDELSLHAQEAGVAAHQKEAAAAERVEAEESAHSESAEPEAEQTPDAGSPPA